VARLVEWNFFDRDLFNSAKVLTSVNIQNRYFEAIKRRKSPKPTLYVINVDINSTSSDVNADINTQSKVKESKVNQTKEPKTTETTKDIYINAREEIFNKIETEFGRPLSPIELETIGIWIDEDHFSYEIIICALQEAVLNQVWNLKYMNTILQNWSKQHITNKQEYAAMKQQRANQKAPVEPVAAKKNLPKIPIYKISEQDIPEKNITDIKTGETK
jgi:DnaD/phage-associated family protein